MQCLDFVMWAGASWGTRKLLGLEEAMLRAAILAGCLVFSNAALADNFDGEMTFQYYTVAESLLADHPHVEVQADGGITKNTPQLFRQFLADHDVPRGSDVYFTSGGGNLGAGLKLGRLIREHGLNAVVGAHTPISNETISFLKRNYNAWMLSNLPFQAPILPMAFRSSSYCISACTFAFLGGVHRYIGNGSIFAVHKFDVDCGAVEYKNLKICREPAESMSQSQELSADLAVYLEQMGIPQRFLQDMVLAEPDKIKVLTCEELEKYHIYDAALPNYNCHGF